MTQYIIHQEEVAARAASSSETKTAACTIKLGMDVHARLLVGSIL